MIIMNKIASLVKEAEVRGVLAGLVDGGHLKIASAEDLEALTEVVSGAVEGYDYDLNTILSKTAEVMEALENEGQDKEASEDEVDETAVMAAFGELSMMKMAGEIDEESFEKEAANLKAIMEGAKAGAKSIGGKIKEIATGSRIKPLMDSVKSTKKRVGEFTEAGVKPSQDLLKHLKKVKGSTAKEVGKTVGLYGAAAGATGLGGKALYDKYKK